MGRNVAEGIARAFLARRSRSASADESGGCARGSGAADDVAGVDVTLVSVVGEDDAGKALVAGCEDAGIRAEGTVEVGGGGGRDQAGTASYVAMLDGERPCRCFVGRWLSVAMVVVVVFTLEVVYLTSHPSLPRLFWSCSERRRRSGGGGRGYESIRGHDAGRSLASLAAFFFLARARRSERTSESTP